MGRTLTEHSINTLCHHMRTIDVIKSDLTILDESPGMREDYEKYCAILARIIGSMTPEQLDELLEAHRFQRLEIEEEFEKRKHGDFTSHYTFPDREVKDTQS